MPISSYVYILKCNLKKTKHNLFYHAHKSTLLMKKRRGLKKGLFCSSSFILCFGMLLVAFFPFPLIWKRMSCPIDDWTALEIGRLWTPCLGDHQMPLCSFYLFFFSFPISLFLVSQNTKRGPPNITYILGYCSNLNSNWDIYHKHIYH